MHIVCQKTLLMYIFMHTHTDTHIDSQYTNKYKSQHQLVLSSLTWETLHGVSSKVSHRET